MTGKESNYLRRQAEACIALSRSTFDLTLARRLRTLADDFRQRAAEWDHEPDDVSARTRDSSRTPGGT